MKDKRLDRYMELCNRYMETQTRINIHLLELNVKLRKRVEKLENLNELYTEAEREEAK